MHYIALLATWLQPQIKRVQWILTGLTSLEFLIAPYIEVAGFKPYIPITLYQKLRNHVKEVSAAQIRYLK